MSNVSLFRQSVAEADIDWVVCIELNASEPFRRWLGARLFETYDFKHARAWRSVSDVVGESDLLWLVESPSQGRLVALIENKIAAAAQPDQFQRYVQRGENLVEEGVCERVIIALLAPERYVSRDSEAYPVRISYEDLKDWFEQQHDPRSLYLSSIFEAAVERARTNAPVDEGVSNFLRAVWLLASHEFPELNLAEPKPVSASQYWVYLPQNGYTLIYKMYKRNGVFLRSVVHLELSGRGPEISRLEEEYRNKLAGTDIKLVRTGQSASFEIEVPAITPPDFDEDKVREALRAASRLKAWWESS